MFCKVETIGLMGMNAFPVDVEIEISRGIERFDIVGLADISVKESRERIKSAFRSSMFKFPAANVVVNLAPADVKKAGSTHDLAIAERADRIFRMDNGILKLERDYIGGNKKTIDTF